MDNTFKVDFMIVGAQKCGTTSLTKMLARHSSIVACNQKEPMFFSSTNNWEQEISDYHSLYQWQENSLHFEASTSYTCYPHHNLAIWKDLHAYNPHLKIIYIVRNPVDRIISSYMHSYKRGYINNWDIKEAIVEEPILLNMTRYATQIRPFIEQFGAGQVKILFFDDLIADRTAIIDQLSDFLEIPSSGFSSAKNIHANKSLENFKIHRKYDHPGFVLAKVRRYLPALWKIITDNSGRSFKRKPKLSHQQQEMILGLLAKEIEELEDMTGRDLSSWRRIKKVEPSQAYNDYHLSRYEAALRLFNRIKEKLQK